MTPAHLESPVGLALELERFVCVAEARGDRLPRSGRPREAGGAAVLRDSRRCCCRELSTFHSFRLKNSRNGPSRTLVFVKLHGVD